MLSEDTPLHEDRIVINGFGGKTFSLGYVNLTLRTQNGSFNHKFYLFNNLPFKSEGILGLDFLTKFNSHINLENNTLTLHNECENIMPLYATPTISQTY